MFIVASGIGIYYAYKDRKKKDTDNYYFGGSELSPVSLYKWYCKLVFL